MKRHELIFSIVKIPLDFFVILWAFFLARELRLVTDLIPGVSLPIQTIGIESLNLFALSWALLYVLLFASHRLYSLQISHSKIQEILDVTRYGIYWFLFFSVGVYLWNGIIYSGAEIPRLIIIFTTFFGISWSIMIRLLLNTVQSQLLKHKKISPRNLLLISNKSEDTLWVILADIEASRIYNIIWYSNSREIQKNSLRYLWNISNLEKISSQHQCDEILYIDSDFSKEELYKIWELARSYGIRYRYITNNFDVTKTNTALSLINQTPVIEILNTPLDNWNRIIKRLFDIFLSFCILLFSLPFACVIALLIKLEDPAGPVIYKNRRIGQNGQVFNCYKFRYLKWKHCIKESYWVKNTDDPAIAFENTLIENQSTRSWPLYKIQRDPRKTKIGDFLERNSLDEFPQFFNVMMWDMSIVWPRPHQPREVQKYEQYQKQLLTIKPGITGMAQVNGREQNSFVKEAELDIFYIENWNFLLDLKIMWKTLAIIFSRN